MSFTVGRLGRRLLGVDIGHEGRDLTPPPRSVRF
jgi:hypothetical protein